MGACPHCKNHLASVRGDHVTVSTPGTNWKGIAYVCPACSAIISVGIDPVALKTDTIDGVVAALSKRR